jgi:hypothetical protein
MHINSFRSLSVLLLFTTCASVATAQSGTVPWPLLRGQADPDAFGTQDETITVISAVSFSSLYPDVDHYNQGYYISPSFGRYCYCPDRTAEYYAGLDLPAGAVIDYVGINNTTDTDSVMGIALWQRDRYGAKTFLFGRSLPAHGWDTDLYGPVGIQVPDHVDKELVIQVEQAPSLNGQFFAWVEVRWHRTVSPPPATASFNDVPTTDLAFQFVEALAASGITAGCGGGNYCPDAPLTRRQMAVFLAKALGLHWPN